MNTTPKPRRARRVVPSLKCKHPKVLLYGAERAWWYEDRRGIEIISWGRGPYHGCRIGWGILRRAMQRCYLNPTKAKRAKKGV